MSDRHAPQSTSADSTTVIGKGIHIEGELTGSAPIEVWGSLQGVTGTEGRFWVREGGQVGGKIAAKEVIIEGQVEGEITAQQKVEFRPTCKVKGDVIAKKVAIAEGAVFDGRIRMSDTGPFVQQGQQQGQSTKKRDQSSQDKGPQDQSSHNKGPRDQSSHNKGPHNKGPHGNKPSRN